MKKSVSQKALNVVEQFIRMNIDEDDSMKLSTNAIGEVCGLSNATVWRALNQMAEIGIITIIKPFRRSEPLTIIYNGLRLNALIDNAIAAVYSDLELALAIINNLTNKVNNLVSKVKQLEKEQLKIEKVSR